MGISKKIIFLTNIVAPYRVSLFNNMENLRLSNKYEFDFEVYFMRISEFGRNWKIDLKSLKFKYLLGNGLYLCIKNFHFHFNPVLVVRVLLSKNEVVLGSSWNDLNVLLIIFLKRIGLLKNRLSVWSEANYLTNQSQKKNVFRDLLRRWVFNSIDGSFIVPGKMSIISFEKWNIEIRNVIMLPNLVSEQLFTPARNYQVNKIKPIFLIVARLEEDLKGIKNFMTSVGHENLKKIELRIIGSGSDYIDYVSYVEKHQLKDNIIFLGDLSQELVSVEYKLANVFLLPSYSDPSPLSIVEAIFSGLPLLVSNRCGNHFETVVDGLNGYTFDPYDSNDIKIKFEQLISEIQKWDRYSKKSIEIAHANFKTEKVLNSFIKQIVYK